MSELNTDQQHSKPDDRGSLRIVIALLAIVAGAAALRAYELGRQSLWIDEVFSLEQMKFSWAALALPGGYHDVHPPLYFLTLKPFADSISPHDANFEAWVRIPALIASSLFPLAAFLLARALFDRRAGLLAAVFVAVSAFSVWHAQEVRMYSLAILMVTLQLAAAARLLFTDRTRGAGLGLLGGSVAAGLTHWYAVFAWPSIVLATFFPGVSSAARRRTWIVAILTMVILAVYLVPKFINGRSGEDTGQTDWKSLAYTPWAFWTGYSAGPSVNELRGPEAIAAVKREPVAIAVLGGAALLALNLPPAFAATLGGYFLITCLYSFWLKNQVVVDVILLTSLYTIRIVAGGEATGIQASFWLLAFSMFFFLSMAIVKRYSEMLALIQQDQLKAAGRGYAVSDMPVLMSLGTAAGYIAILILALYVNSPDITKLYSNVWALWMVLPPMLYWISRVWMKTHRGEMHDDPVVFAATDRQSWLLAVVVAVAFAFAGGK